MAGRMSIDQTPIAAQISATARLKQREDAIRANGIKQGRIAERAEMLTALGVKALEDVTAIPAMKADLDARWQREEAKHGRFRFYQGGVLGITAGIILGCAMILAMQDAIWDAATRSFREQAMTGAILSAQPAERDLPRIEP